MTCSFCMAVTFYTIGDDKDSLADSPVECQGGPASVIVDTNALVTGLTEPRVVLVQRGAVSKASGRRHFGAAVVFFGHQVRQETHGRLDLFEVPQWCQELLSNQANLY